MKNAGDDVIRAMLGQVHACRKCGFKHSGESPCRVFPESAYEIVRNWRTNNRARSD
jgi:hypothetical protein